jgi:general secretion pathway protein G
VSGGWRRRRFIVRGFQRQFVLRQLVWITAYLFAFAAALLAPLVSRLHNGSAEEQFQAAAQFLFLHEYLWPALGGVLVVAAAALIKTSHRIAGPLYRFRRVFESVTAGDLRASARVRSGDYLTLESDALEAMLASMRERIGAAQQAIDEAGSALRVQGDAPPPNLDAARRAVANARRILRSFTVDSEAGLTLVELLVATAMIGVLAAMGLPAYMHALEAARVAKAIGDIKAIDKDVQMQMVLVGCLPGTLNDIGRDYLRDPWGNPYIYNVLPGKAAGGGGGGGGGNGGGNGNGGGSGNGGGNDGGGSSGSSCAACSGQCVSIGQARKDRKLVPINSDFDLFSPGRDGKTTGPLTAKASQDDIVRGSDGAFVGLGKDY